MSDKLANDPRFNDGHCIVEDYTDKMDKYCSDKQGPGCASFHDKWMSVHNFINCKHLGDGTEDTLIMLDNKELENYRRIRRYPVYYITYKGYTRPYAISPIKLFGIIDEFRKFIRHDFQTQHKMVEEKLTELGALTTGFRARLIVKHMKGCQCL